MFSQFQQIKERNEIALKSEADYVAPYLVYYAEKPPNCEQSVLVYRACLDNLKQDFLEYLNELQRRYDEVSGTTYIVSFFGLHCLIDLFAQARFRGTAFQAIPEEVPGQVRRHRLSASDQGGRNDRAEQTDAAATSDNDTCPVAGQVRSHQAPIVDRRTADIRRALFAQRTGIAEKQTLQVTYIFWCTHLIPTIKWANNRIITYI